MQDIMAGAPIDLEPEHVVAPIEISIPSAEDISGLRLDLEASVEEKLPAEPAGEGIAFEEPPVDVGVSPPSIGPGLIRSQLFAFV